MSKQTPANAVERWFLNERGIGPETLERCKVETSDTEARWRVGTTWKIRTGFGPGEKRGFKYADKGHPLSAFHLPVKSRDIVDPVIVCEGETDAMRLWQEGGKDLYGQISALPGCDAITQDVADKLLKRAGKAPIFFVLDNEKQPEGDYNPDDWKEAKQPIRKVDESWKRIKALLPKARRIYLPEPYKDICEYLDIYSIKDFDKHVVHAERYNFEALDLAQTGVSPEFLWDEVIPRSQFVLLQGESNVGKSLLYQALAVALANGEPEFLGKALKPVRAGRVLIVDEENPEEVIRHRLAQLGLREDCQKNLRIISQRGVRIDLDSDKLFEDVESFGPDLTVLDSFIRLHAQDENSASAVSGMFNTSVLPISRQLGSAVLLLHHVNRTDSGDSRRRTRGSTDIMASVDVGWDLVDHVIENNVTTKFLSRFKTRNGAVRKDLRYRIVDTESGGLDFPVIDGTGDVL